MSYQEWTKVKPQFAKVKLQPEWTNIFNQKIENFYPLCVLLFKYHRINVKYESQRCHFLIAEANCKFTNCITLKLWIDKAPENWEDSVEVNFLVNGSISSEHFDNTTSYSGHVTGAKRKELSVNISSSSPINYHYDQFKSSDYLSSAKHGNFNKIHSQSVLRKIKSQELSRERLNSDSWLDIVSTKKTYDISIQGNIINGYIQSLSRKPIVIHLYSEEQILLLKLFQSKRIFLHLDATGSVVRKLDKGQNKFLYYALTIRHPEAKISPIPLAEMLSSDHTNVEITHFLNRWQYTAKKVLNKEFTPTHVEVDFSLAMLHSTCQSFNHENFENYLKSCWQISKTSWQISESKLLPKTVIHICTAHIMHRFSYKLDRTMRVHKNTKKILLFAMARLVNSTTLEELRHLFVALSISCIAKKLYPEVQQYIGDLEKAINGEQEREYLDTDYLEDLDEELPNDLGDSLTCRSKSLENILKGN